MITKKALLDTIKYIRSNYFSSEKCWCDPEIIDFIINLRKNENTLKDLELVPLGKVHFNDFYFIGDYILNTNINTNTLEIHIGNSFKIIDILTDEERNIKNIIE